MHQGRSYDISSRPQRTADGGSGRGSHTCVPAGPFVISSSLIADTLCGTLSEHDPHTEFARAQTNTPKAHQRASGWAGGVSHGTVPWCLVSARTSPSSQADGQSGSAGLGLGCIDLEIRRAADTVPCLHPLPLHICCEPPLWIEDAVCAPVATDDGCGDHPAEAAVQLLSGVGNDRWSDETQRNHAGHTWS